LGSCNCLVIVDDCSGRGLTLKGFVTIYCGLDGDPVGNKNFTIGTDGKVCGLANYLYDCANARLSMHAGNWEIVSIQSCTLRARQIPRILVPLQ
jgi:hypothetical protein